MNRHSTRGALAALALVACAVLAAPALPARAASWRGIEPLKSRRADVERALGAPKRESPADGALHFEVSGGRVTVFFFTAQTVTSKKLSPEIEGTVIQIVLQHERAQDTPESLGVDKDKKFERTSPKGDTVAYANAKDGVTYTFVNGRLRTTRYSAPAEQLAKAFRKR